jgi:hypothetical protein
LLTDNPKNVAQNLAAESNGFEVANRNQYGNHFGRARTNAFRFDHRLPTDESLVRSFIASPMSTMTNNGVVHVLSQLAKHWENMLSQEWGNFAHQRMEQLDPFETLRFHIPVVLVTLASLRGRNRWDSHVLGPFISKIQALEPATTADPARALIRELLEEIIIPVSAGVESVTEPFTRWAKAISMACDGIDAEAQIVFDLVTSVEIGICLGHDVITTTDWKVPPDSVLKVAILNHIRGKSTDAIPSKRIHTAMQLTTPRDKRTLMELVLADLTTSKPAQLLLSRVKTLLQRELRREELNKKISELALGDYLLDIEHLVHNQWYWLDDGQGQGFNACVYDGPVRGGQEHRFTHLDSWVQKLVTLPDSVIQIREYNPIAEAITRAQKVYMTIELDCGKCYTLNAFAEYTFMRVALLRLAVVSQMCCEVLDLARLNVLPCDPAFEADPAAS